MKTRILVLTITAALAATAFALAGDDNTPKPRTDREIDQLKSQISTLESRVKKLEEQLTELESRKPPFIWMQPPGASPGRTSPEAKPRSLLPRIDQPPLNWGTREFNGMTFYLVPCTGDSAGVPAQSAAQK